MDTVSAEEANETIIAAGGSAPFIADRARRKMVEWVKQNRDFENKTAKMQVSELVKEWNMV